MELTTPRLVLREFRLSDFDAVRAYDGDPEVQRYERESISPEETRATLEKVIQQAQQNPRQNYRLAITLPPQDTAIGYISLILNNEQIREWEIGWRMQRRYWGQGLATEGAREVMRLAFTRLGAHRLIAFCHSENKASERVMQKLGMRREGWLRETRRLHDAWHDELVYGILDREFCAAEMDEKG